MDHQQTRCCHDMEALFVSLTLCTQSSRRWFETPYNTNMTKPSYIGRLPSQFSPVISFYRDGSWCQLTWYVVIVTAPHASDLHYVKLAMYQGSWFCLIALRVCHRKFSCKTLPKGPYPLPIVCLSCTSPNLKVSITDLKWHDKLPE